MTARETIEKHNRRLVSELGTDPEFAWKPTAELSVMIKELDENGKPVVDYSKPRLYAHDSSLVTVTYKEFKFSTVDQEYTNCYIMSSACVSEGSYLWTPYGWDERLWCPAGQRKGFPDVGPDGACGHRVYATKPHRVPTLEDTVKFIRAITFMRAEMERRTKLTPQQAQQEELQRKREEQLLAADEATYQMVHTLGVGAVDKDGLLTYRLPGERSGTIEIFSERVKKNEEPARAPVPTIA